MEERIDIKGNILFLEKKKLLITEDKIDKYIRLSDRIVVLTSSNISKKNDNVFCYDFSGKLIWRVEPSPPPIDFFNYYTEIYLKDEKLIAYNFEGFEFTIDMNNGRILKKEFVK